MLLLAAKPPGGSHPPLTRAMAPARGALIARDDHPEWRQLLIKAALRRADALNQLRALPDDPPAATPLADQGKPAAGDAAASAVEAPDVDMPPVIGDISPMEQRVATLPATQNEADLSETVAGDTAASVADAPDDVMPPDVGEIAPFEPRVAALPADQTDATFADLNVALPTEDEVTGSIAATPPIGSPVPLPRKRPADLNAPQRAEPARPSRRARRAQVTAQAPQQIDFFQALFGGFNANQQGANARAAGTNPEAAPR